MTCGFATHVDRHFSGSIDPAGEHALREHLPECAACRERYQRRLVLERMDPRARGVEERLARGLGLRRPPVRWMGLGMAVAAAAAVILLAPKPPAQFATRGAKLGPQLAVFKLRAGETSRPVGEAIAVKDELAFAYLNPGEAKYLLVFGVDEHKHVYWYHPAWLDPDARPVAVRIEQDDKMHELPEAIAHPLDGRKLDIVAVFAPRAVSVTEVEERVAQHAADAPLGITGAVEARTRLRVEK